MESASQRPANTDTSTEPGEQESDPEHEAIELRRTSNNQARPRESINQSSLPAFLQPLCSDLGTFWKRHIRVTVPHVACRDHLANERTYLSYLRTSLGFSFLGVIIAQLFRLQHSARPNATLGFFVLAKPLSLICQSVALIICLVGTARYFRQQSAMALGKVHAGGWELLVTGTVCGMVLLTLFVVVLAVVVDKAKSPIP